MCVSGIPDDEVCMPNHVSGKKVILYNDQCCEQRIEVTVNNHIDILPEYLKLYGCIMSYNTAAKLGISDSFDTVCWIDKEGKTMNKKKIFNPEIFVAGHAYLIGDKENPKTMLLRYYEPERLTFTDSDRRNEEYYADETDLDHIAFIHDLNNNILINRHNVFIEIYDMKDIDELFTVGHPYRITFPYGSDSSWFGLFLRYDLITNSLIFAHIGPKKIIAESISIKDIENDNRIRIEALYDWDDEENNISDIIRQQKVGNNNEQEDQKET